MRTPDLFAKVWFRRPVRCAGEGCKTVLRHPQDGIFVIRGPRAVGFCDEQCFLSTTDRVREQLQVDRKTGVDLLGPLGYERRR